jgi:hypothetical protein
MKRQSHAYLNIFVAEAYVTNVFHYNKSTSWGRFQIFFGHLHCYMILLDMISEVLRDFPYSEVKSADE